MLATDTASMTINNNTPIRYLQNREDIMQFILQHPLRTITSTTMPDCEVVLDHFDFQTGLERMLPANHAETYRAVPLMLYEGYLIIAMAKHDSVYEDIKSIEFITGHRVETFNASQQQIDQGLENIYGANALLGLSQHQPKHADAEEDIRRQTQSRPILQLANRIIHEAAKKKLPTYTCAQRRIAWNFCYASMEP